MDQWLEELKENGLAYYTMDRFISIGSTRAVFEAGGYVIKKHMFPYAFEQSRREQIFYESLPEHLKGWFTVPYYVCEEYAIFERVEPLSKTPWEDYCELMENDETELWHLFLNHRTDLTLQKVGEIIEEIKQCCKKWEIEFAELMSNDNIGTVGEQFKCLDYGMSQDFFDDYYQAKTEGLIPYIDYGECQNCKGDLYAPVFDEGDPIFWFGHCTCGKYPNEYPLEVIEQWLSD